VWCSTCGESFGLMGSEKQAEIIDAHYQTCTAYLHGEGLKKERPIAFSTATEEEVSNGSAYQPRSQAS